MTDLPPPTSTAEELQAEIVRLNKIIQSLMNRAERNASIQGSEFNLFQTAVMLEDKVKSRTVQLEKALQENKKVTRTLRETENNLRLLIDNAPVSIHQIDLEGKVVSMSKAGLQMHNHQQEREVVGTLFINDVRKEDRKRVQTGLKKAFAGETNSFEFIAIKRMNKILKSCVVPIVNNDGTITRIMGITEDITERKRVEKRINELVFNDALTHLPNRRLLHNRLTQAMNTSSHSGLYGAVMFLDLDNFKPLNDTHGHELGDLLLIEVARRIKSCIRKSDTVARMGGDEFVVMLSEMDKDIELAALYASTVAEKIRIVLAKPYSLQRVMKAEEETTVEYNCSVSTGIKLFLGNDISEEDILKFADEAMYLAKKSGRNTIKFYKPEESARLEKEIARKPEDTD